MPRSTEVLAKQFNMMMCEHHHRHLMSGDEALRDAVIVKMVALTSLAFDIGPTPVEPLNARDCLVKLHAALKQIEERKLVLEG